jgi:hypothetical protein
MEIKKYLLEKRPVWKNKKGGVKTCFFIKYENIFGYI